MNTKTIAEAMAKKYRTRNPFDLAEAKNIIVLFEPLGNILGFYNRCYRQSFIHINQELDGNHATFTCAHELGHAILHPKVNTPFLREYTMFSVDKLELNANRFAVDLLYDDEELRDFLSRPINDAVAYMGVPQQLAEYRLSSILKGD